MNSRTDSYNAPDSREWKVSTCHDKASICGICERHRAGGGSLSTIHVKCDENVWLIELDVIAVNDVTPEYQAFAVLSFQNDRAVSRRVAWTQNRAITFERFGIVQETLDLVLRQALQGFPSKRGYGHFLSTT
ncbi:hypothetical protein EDF70_1172 [Neorhizobium sp. JUb45]|nr:hypothetical protein EDF70_1172 [Neorhizobium sp. JUb45]